MHHIYPEGEWALGRIAEDPAHLFFKAYGKQVPAGDWNETGTKQGIYMMGPDGEYLEGAHAVSGDPKRLIERLEAALERWKGVKKEKKYEGKDIPVRGVVAPPEIDAAPLALRVSMRDLPRGEGDTSGRRRTKKDLRGRGWMAFTEWAWNQKWHTLDDPMALVAKRKKAEDVPKDVAERIARHAFVDNVRGQNPAWKAEHIKELTLTKRVLKTEKKHWVIAYEGSVLLEDGAKRFEAKLYGEAEWNHIAKVFDSLRIVTIGERAGAAMFNQRAKDKAPAPMGVLIELHRGEADAKDDGR